MSAVKAPGRMAIEEIEADLLAGRSDVAKAKIVALKQQWAVFNGEDGFMGRGLGDIVMTFGQIDSAMEMSKTSEPGGRANGSQRSRPE